MIRRMCLLTMMLVTMAVGAQSFDEHPLFHRPLTYHTSLPNTGYLWPSGTMGAADFDGDGDVDIFVVVHGAIASTRGHAHATWILENRDGAGDDLEYHLICEASRYLRSFPDLNGDGAADLLTTGPLRWGEYRDGSVIEHLIFPLSANRIHALDWDDDGDTDLVANFSDSIVRLFENSGEPEPTFTQHWLVQNFAGQLSVGDIDGDGLQDLVERSVDAGITWRQRLSGNQFATPMHILDVTDDGNLFVHDVDHDAVADIVYMTRNGSGQVNWIENTEGDGSSWAHQSFEAAEVSDNFRNSDEMLRYDVDGDGWMDLVIHDNVGTVRWYHPTQTSDGTSHWFPIGHVTNDHEDITSFPFTWDDGRPGLWLDDVDSDGDTDFLGVQTGVVHKNNIHVIASWTDWWYGGSVLWFENRTPTLAISSIEMVNTEESEFHLPGEQGTLEITLHNQRTEALHNTVVSPESLHPGLVFTDGAFTVASIPSGETLNFSIPYLISEQTPCGTEITGGVRVTSDEGPSTLRRVSIHLGQAVSSEITLSDPQQEVIPDGDPTGLSRSFDVSLPLGYTITGAVIAIDLTHSRPQDLLVRLISPDGTVSPIETDEGVTMTVVELPALIGKGTAGSYTLEVVDELAGNPGTFNSAMLSLQYQGTTCGGINTRDLVDRLLGDENPTGNCDFNGDGVVDIADMVWGLSRGI